MIHTSLYPFQRQGVRRLVELDGRALLADEVGLGKTIQSLYYAWRFVPDDPPGPIVVLCPAHLKIMWSRQAKQHLGLRVEILDGQSVPPGKLPPHDPNQIYVINYEIVSPPRWKRGTAPAPDSWLVWLANLNPRLVIADECFPFDAEVLTDRGVLKIGEIVEHEIPAKVFSVDLASSRVELRSVLHYIKKQRDTRMVTIRHSEGTLRCTENHPIWTVNRGYVNASDLSSEDTLRVVSGETRVREESVLRQVVLGEVANASAVGQRKDLHPGGGREAETGESGQKTAGPVDSDEGEQPVEAAGGRCEDEGYEGGQRNAARLCRDAGRQRTNYQAGGVPSRRARPGVAVSDRDSDGTEIRIGVSDFLQGGCRTPTDADRHRGGWKGTQLGTEEEAGREKDSPLIDARVESVEVYEQGDRRGLGGSAGPDSYVYCLEVEGNHNFFADGVLVSNCHRMKTPGTAANRAGEYLGKRVQRFIQLTGTPQTNKVPDMWALIHILYPRLFPSRMDFLARYTWLRKRWWGWESKGARNLEELHEILLKHCMIRRRKADVLKDLPRITYSVIPVEINMREYRAAELDYIAWLAKKSPTLAANAARAQEISRQNGLKMLAGKLKVAAVRAWSDELLAETDGKLLMGVVHKEVGRALLHSFGKSAVLVNGDMNRHEKQQAFDRFNDNPNCTRLVGNLQAAGTGWSCTSTADVAVCEMPWVPADIEQFVGRIHGIERGLPGVTSHVRFLIAHDTIEDDICRVLQQKRVWAAQTVDGKGDTGDYDIHAVVRRSIQARHGG